MSSPDSDAMARQPPSDTLPSSFDDNPEFFEEARMQKLWRKIKQEPLIPIGCLATSYALYQATKSIRRGDHTQTNRMFRARIYAQGFTLAALVAGSFYYKDERMRRKSFEAAVEDKKAAEKREKWLRELEIRDEEERAWRKHVESGYEVAADVAAGAKQAVRETGKEVKKAVEDTFSSKSIADQVHMQRWGPVTWALRASDAWRRA